MAFPVVESVGTFDSTSNVTIATMGAPSGVADGDLLLAIVGYDNASNRRLGLVTGWHRIQKSLHNGSGNGMDVFAKIGTGNEATADWNLCLSGSEAVCSIIYRISGWNISGNNGLGSIEVSSVEGTGSGTNYAGATITPSWGSEDTLFVTAFSGLATPTSNVPFSNGWNFEGSNSATRGQAAVCYEQSTDATWDPGNWTSGTSNAVYSSVAIAIRTDQGSSGSARPRLVIY